MTELIFEVLLILSLTYPYMATVTSGGAKT